MHADTSRIGASYLSKRAVFNPREIVTRLVTANPGASKEDLFPKFREEIKDDADYQRAIDWYFFVNMYEYEATSRNKKQSPQARKKAEQKLTAAVEVVKEKIKARLLDLVMPNDKSMGECTGAEMDRFGGAYRRIARKVGKTKLVGAVLDEAQVRAILR